VNIVEVARRAILDSSVVDDVKEHIYAPYCQILTATRIKLY
jgi:hypothetical protein